jgi:hypothetical protein
VLFIDPKIRVGLEFMTFRLRIPPYWVNGFLSFLPKMVSSKPFLKESISGLRWRFAFLGGSDGLHDS